MKKLDFIRYMGNINEKYVIESEKYKPMSRNWIKITAIAACITILVTSIPLAFILNREDVQEHNHETNDPVDIIENYENIQLKSGSLILDTIQLSNGKIIKNMEDAHPYVYEYDKVDGDAVYAEMIESAFKYHEPRYLAYPNTVSDIGNASYNVYVFDEIVSKAVSCNNHDTYVNNLDPISGGNLMWDGSFYVPSGVTGEYLYTFLGPEIEKLGDYFGCKLDSYVFYSDYSSTGNEPRGYQLFLWDSSNKEVNDRIEQLDKTKYTENYGGYTKDYLEFGRYAIVIDLFLYENRMTNRVNVSAPAEIYKTEKDTPFISRLDYLSLNIGGQYYRCASSDADIYACAMQLEQYLIDVFKIAGLTGLYEVNYSEYSQPERNNGVIAEKRITFNTKQTKGHENETVTFIFKTLDNEIYFLDDISNRYSVAKENYIELIDKQTAITRLAQGYCIGDVGLGCRICRDGYLQEVIEYIEENIKCELVLLPDIVFKTNDNTIIYDFPFYAFTVPAEKEGSYYVAYVPAAIDGEQFDIDPDELYSCMFLRNMIQCPSYNDHDAIAEAKDQRIEEMIREMLEKVPDKEKKVVYSQLIKRYLW